MSTANGKLLVLVAAMGCRREIGNAGGMPWHLPADLRHFKQVTDGWPMVMGRRTWESLPGALPGRQNIVVSSREQPAGAGEVDWVGSLETAFARASGEQVMIIGGASLYAATLAQADAMELTLIDAEFEADTWFPAWERAHWHEVASESRPADERNPYALRFVRLERLA